MTRKFTIGRQNEVLMNDEHYTLYKIMQYFLDHPEDLDRGPTSNGNSDGDVINGSMWLDRYSNSNSADLKYFNNGQWRTLFADKFKLLEDLLSENEPTDPIEGQMWINKNGALTYYHNGQFQVVKAATADEDDESSLQYEDFLIIESLKGSNYAVLNNFSKFLFAKTPIEKWKPDTLYSYQQGAVYNDVLYICNKEHYSGDASEGSNLITPDNAYYWTRMDTLIQFLVPNSLYDKLFVNGKFIHEKVNEIIDELEKLLFKSFGVTFDDESEDTIHTDLLADVDGDNGYYDTISLTLEENLGDIVETPSDIVTPDKNIEEEEGYIVNTNTAVYIPIDEITVDEDDDNEDNFYETEDKNKLVSAIHVNPIKLYNIEKYFVEIDNDRIVAIPKENTEYYGIKNGIGTLLLENTENFIYDYASYIKDGFECIKLTKKAANKYDYVYALHYTFSNNIRQAGKLVKKRIKLNQQQSIYIGKVNPNNIAVFAQGLYYQQLDDTYIYNLDDGYIYLKEKMIDEITQERLELSVLKFPYIHKGTITLDNYKDENYSEDKGYRVELNSSLLNPDKCIGFMSGIQIDPNTDYYYDDKDLTGIYFPKLTKKYVQDHDGDIHWVIAETDYTVNGETTFAMNRGRTKSIKISDNKYGIKITRDINNATDDVLFLDYLEAPMFFMNGILISQNALDIEEDYIAIKDVKAGNNLLMLASPNSRVTLDDITEKTEILVNLKNFDPEHALRDNETNRKLIEDIPTIEGYEEILNSYVYEDFRYIHSIYNFDALLQSDPDYLLFQDNAANINIPIDLNDSVVMYLKSGLICDTESVLVSKLPSTGYNGEIKHLLTAVEDSWYKYYSNTGVWSKIPQEDIDNIIPDVNGYFSTSKNISVIKDLDDEKYCTYFAYTYSNTVENKLLTGYCIPDGNMGTKDGLVPYYLNNKHRYCPGRNELTVYVNGIRQELNSPYDSAYEQSYTKECNTSGDNSFLFSIDDGSQNGKALTEYEGYFTYKVGDDVNYYYIYKDKELTSAELAQYENIELISKPAKNVLFYVVEPTESNENSACEKYKLTYKDCLSSKGAYYNSTYKKQGLNLSKGNITVFIDGIRQPYGTYEDLDGNSYAAYKILNSNTIQIQDILIGAQGINAGTDDNPLFEIGESNTYYSSIDEILIELRNDYNLREITIPISAGKFELTVQDGLPKDIFDTKDELLIYINGLAYGNDYMIDSNVLTLKNEELLDSLDNNVNNFITIEWR